MTSRLPAQQLTFPGTAAGLAGAASQLRGFLDSVALTGARRYQIELAFDELASNIIRHGHPIADIDVAVACDGAEVILTFDDDGQPFDPRTHTPRALDTDLSHAGDGGFGIRLVRTFATRFDYERTAAQHNRLIVAIPID
jgi:anti-sigma regulatory factor (Ser/Thr protein kinase)